MEEIKPEHEEMKADAVSVEVFEANADGNLMTNEDGSKKKSDSMYAYFRVDKGIVDYGDYSKFNNGDGFVELVTKDGTRSAGTTTLSRASASTARSGRSSCTPMVR